MRIFLRGYYGGQNAGDDALLWVILRELDLLAPGATVRVAPDVNSAIPDTSLTITGAPRLRGGRYLAAALNDMMLYGGGGVIQEYSEQGRILAGHLRLSRWARAFGAPCVYLGVSAGPLEGAMAHERTRQIVEQATLVTLRDRASLRLLEEIGAVGNMHATHDIALLLGGDPPLPHEPPERPVLGVSANAFHRAAHHDPDADLRVHETIAAALDPLMADNPDLQIKLLCLHSGEDSDLWAARHLQASLRAPERAAIVPYAADPQRTLAEIAGCPWVLGFRLHAAVFAYACGVPVFAIDYHPKVAGFAEMIDLPDESRMPLAELDAPRLTDALQALVRGELPPPRVPLADSLAAARRNFELLAGVLRE